MNAPDDLMPLRLTRFSHGGGCGCKVAPSALREILHRSAQALVPGALLVGTETSDDAAVYRLSDTEAIVATTDFFMPIVDDPFDFGSIAATNALSDIYAMGATPLFALALVAMPVQQLPVATIRSILEGGESACARAGIPIAGGHTIDSIEPIYGLAAIGRTHPARIKRNSGAQPGDTLILGKPLGVGVYSAALRKQALADADYAALLASATRLNTPGIALGTMDAVHALTDVTGFGLLGHMLEVCRGSGVGARIDFNAIPLLPSALALARSGFVTGASDRNWADVSDDVRCNDRIDAAQRALLCDPQTSGGLLVACAPDAADDVLAVFAREHFVDVRVIGRCISGPGMVQVV